MASAEVNTPYAQYRYILRYLRTLRSNIPGFQLRVVYDTEEGFPALSRSLAGSLPCIAAVRQESFGDPQNEFMGPLREVLQPSSMS